jgi:amino acid adenylation domain-containing protein
LHAEALERALIELQRRHEVLRTSFPSEHGLAIQQVLPGASFVLERCDRRDSLPEARAEEIRALAQAEVQRPFDLARGPVWRARLVCFDESDHGLVLCLHHIVSDGWSVGVLARDLAALYEAFRAERPSPLPELLIQYGDFAAWQRERLQGALLARHLMYWKTQLAELPVLELPQDFPPPASPSWHGSRHTHWFAESLVSQVRALAQACRVTPFAVWLAGFYLTLHRYTGAQDIALGSPVANRTRTELEVLMGCFVNTLVLRIDLRDDPDFATLVRRVQEVSLAAQEHQDLPFEKLVAELHPDRHQGLNPFFRVMFALQPAPAAPLQLAGLSLEPIEVDTGVAKLDLEFLLWPAGEGMALVIRYRRDLFTPATIERMCGHYQVLLERGLLNPASRGSEVALMTEVERQIWLGDRADGQTASAEPGSGGMSRAECLVLERVKALGRERSAALAVASLQDWVSYGELLQRAEAVGLRLRRLGVGPEVLVAVCCERSVDLIVGWLGVWLAGGAYVPLDPALPDERLQALWTETGAPVALVQRHLRERLRTGPGEVLCLDDCPADEVVAEDALATPQPVGPQHLAYVIYTSGSTGTPKGVAVTHGSLARLVGWHLDAYGVTAEDRATQLAGLGFDAAVWEVWPCLAAGASLRLPDEEVRTSPSKLREWLVREQITLTFLPTPLAEAVLDGAWPEGGALRTLLTGGDRLRRWAPEGLPFALVNHYGPTEATVVATSGPVSTESAGGLVLPAIGRALPYVRAYVLDGRQNLVPEGVVGELYLGGDGLARGYLGRPEWTAAAFLPDGVSGGRGQRLYRTGDLVRWRPGRILEFVGRADAQVKVRGYRIELGEIESVVRRRSGLKDCAVITVGEAADARLVGFAVLERGTDWRPAAFVDELRQQLPDYLVPGDWTVLDQLPLTPNGKIDRRALAKVVRPDRGRRFEAPRPGVEELVAGIWEDVLASERVGATDDFFALGGHSLLATRMMARVQEVCGVDVPLRRLFEEPTVRALARWVEQAGAGVSRRALPAVVPVRRDLPLPLSFAQQRLWFVAQLPSASAAYHIAGALRLRGELDAGALERSLQEIGRRHESLRTVFPAVDGEPVQQIRREGDFRLDQEDLTAFAEADREARARDRATAIARQAFDLARGPLFRARLLRLGADHHWLVLALHHSVADGWSLGILFRELGLLYEAYVGGGQSPLAELPVQYADYAAWQRRWLADQPMDDQLAYWRGRLGGAPLMVELPFDYAVARVPSYRGDRVKVSWDEALMSGLFRLGRQEGATLFMTVLAGFAALLARYSGQSDVVVGTPLANRRQPEVEGLIGFFVNTVALRVEAGGAMTFRQMLRQVREVVLGAHEHQDLPFERLVESMAPARELHRHPLFQVMLSVQRGEAHLPALRHLEVQLEPIDSGTAKFDWVLTVAETASGWVAALDYRSDLFRAATARRALEHLSTLLRSAVDDPNRLVRALPMLGQEEHEQLAEWGRARFSDACPEVCVHELFAQQASRTPKAIAIADEGETITYRDLNERADRLAARLRDLGVGPEVPVALYAERSIALVVGLIGVLKAGGAYVPLDLAYPAERLAYMMADSGAPVLLTQRALQQNLPPHGAAVVLLDEALPLPSALPADGVPGPATDPEQLAYLIYTSGSTGQPKGTAIPHRAIVRLVCETNYVDLTPQDVVAQASNVSFDAATFEVWGALLRGARLVIVPRAITLSPGRLADYLRETGVTTLFLTTALFNQMASERPAGFAGLRQLLFGGELVDLAWVRKVLRAGAPQRLLHVYGPTESTTFATWHPVEELAEQAITVPIGRPVRGTTAWILDADLQVVPQGVKGELCLGGSGLMRGYWNRPELTAERLVPNPLGSEPGSRLYRTGDVCRYAPEGVIEFVGRPDRQVKLRGFRVELGEVEAALAEHAEVEASTVLLREDEPGEKQLVAYAVRRAGATAGAGELRQFLAHKLPGFMVPAVVMVLEALPLNANGKLDREALPRPAGERRSAAAYVAPENRWEKAVAAIWRDLLRLERVGVHDNFFELGGHSLLLVRVQRRLRDQFRREVGIVDLFRFPTVGSLAAHLAGSGRGARDEVFPDLAARVERQRRRGLEPIAVVGMAGRFPGARDIGQFWENLRTGRESIRPFSEAELLEAGVDPALLRDPHYVKCGAVVEDPEWFDAGFFGLNPREAQIMDPQQRLFLECAWEAIEDAACDPEQFGGLIGVFAGAGTNAYLQQVMANPDVMATAGGYQVKLANALDFVATRVSYKLNFSGPSLTVQAACSTSLIAVQVACQSLWDHQCDVALAGGATIRVPGKRGYLYQEGMIFSPDGHCRAFDAAAQGAVGGSGVGVVVLKRLADAVADGDAIRAVILGAAVNNDGAAKVGFTAPQVEGQARVIRAAHLLADVDPGTITYVEAHGTGTPMGDPIEVAALTQAFRAGTERRQFCALGSVKTNVGHLDTAAGVTGLIKTVLMLQHGKLAPSLHFERPNPQIQFEDSPFFVNTQLRDWVGEGGVRRAGVSSFGIGGANAHVVLEQAPAPDLGGTTRGVELLVVSGKTPKAVERAASNLADHLRRRNDLSLGDVAWTLQVGRQAFGHRRALVVRDVAEAVARLSEWKWDASGEVGGVRPGVIFLFPGQGAQQINMGRELYALEGVYRQVVEACGEEARPVLGVDLLGLLYPEREAAGQVERLKQTEITQAAMFVVEYALARQWMAWGVQPEAMLGHSLGEYVAATVAGVMDWKDALRLVVSRGRLMQRQTAGTMMAVGLEEAEAATLLGRHEGVWLAAVNGPGVCVVSGTAAGLDRCARELTERGVWVRRLETSHAFHSGMMTSVVEPFVQEVRRVTLREPERPYLSGLTGRWVEPGEVTRPEFWGRQLLEPVRFGAAVMELLKEPGRVYLEVGPGDALGALVRRAGGTGWEGVVAGGLGGGDWSRLWRTLGRLWCAGIKLDWPAVRGAERRRRIALPTYPFERQRHWVDGVTVQAARPASRPLEKQGDVSEWLYVPSWIRGTPRTMDRRESPPWLAFAGHDDLSQALLERLRAATQEVWVVKPGQAYREIAGHEFSVDPSRKEDYAAVWRTLGQQDRMPSRILYLWSAAAPKAEQVPPIIAGQHADFHHLLFLVQTLAEADRSGAARTLTVVTTEVLEVTGRERIRAEQATVHGLAKVIPQELPQLKCRVIDVEEWPVQPSAMDSLLGEAGSPPTDPVVALRGHYRWVQTYQPLATSAETERAPVLRPGGVYLITGGLGDVGLALATGLARQCRARLILTARSPLPPRSAWEHWLADCDPEDPVAARIRKVQAIEALGSTVLVGEADAADADRMGAVLAEAERCFGRVHGWIHAAGITQGSSLRPLEELSVADGEAQFRPKVQGLYVLEQLLAGRRLDFCALTSSLSAVLGGLNFGAYAAANAFMDAFAHRANRAGGTPWISVNWDGWWFGQAADAQRAGASSLLKLALTPEEGMAAFERLVGAREVSQVAVSTAPLSARLAQWVKREAAPAGAAVAAAPQSRPGLQTAYVAPRNATEETIAAVWAEVLGLGQVGVNDNFFELGGHSLLATQLLARLRGRLQVDVPLNRVFDSPTVAEQAAFVVEQQTANSDKMADALRRLKSLSPEERRRLLEPRQAGGGRS